MYERTIICLANSRKPPSSTGRCIAGKEIGGDREGQWIRPVSARPGHEVSVRERRYQDGNEVELLDTVKIQLIEYSPMVHQVENHILDSDYRWSKEGMASWEQITAMIDPYDEEFWQISADTSHGINDEISGEQATTINSSLKLVFVPRIELRVQTEQGFQGRRGRRRVRGYFTYENINYLLSVTDPNIEEQYLRLQNGEYLVNDAILCVSLSEIWEETGDAYRLVASVITQDNFET